MSHDAVLLFLSCCVLTSARYLDNNPGEDVPNSEPGSDWETASHDGVIPYSPDCTLKIQSAGPRTYYETWNGDIIFEKIEPNNMRRTIFLIGLHPERNSVAVKNLYYKRGYSQWGYQWVGASYPGLSQGREYDLSFYQDKFTIHTGGKLLLSIPLVELGESADSVRESITNVRWNLRGSQGEEVQLKFQNQCSKRTEELEVWETASHDGVIPYSPDCTLKIQSVYYETWTYLYYETWNGDIIFEKIEPNNMRRTIFLIGLHPERNNIAVKNAHFKRGKQEWGYQWVDVSYPEKQVGSQGREYDLSFYQDNFTIHTGGKLLLSIPLVELGESAESIRESITNVRWNLRGDEDQGEDTDVQMLYLVMCDNYNMA